MYSKLYDLLGDRIVKGSYQKNQFSFFLWLKINSISQGLLPLILLNGFQSSRLEAIRMKILQLGFSPSDLLWMGENLARQALRQRVEDTESQLDFSRSPNYVLAPHRCYSPTLATYFYTL